MSKLLAPNGKPSNLNAEQYKLVRSEEFKKWFGDWEILAEAKTLLNDIKGVYKLVALNNIEMFLFEISQQANSSKSEYDGAIKTVGKRIVELSLKLFPNSKVGDDFIPIVSKVVDENEEPLIVWHGGSVENTFNKNKIGLNDDGWYGYGFYFTEDKSFASEWGELKPYFILINNPFNIVQKGISIINPFYNNSKNETDNKIKEGYNGSIAKLSKPNEYVVYYEFSKNIKLADGSNTTFDGSNPDIRFELGGIYQGTPHDFDKYSTEYIGTGEGNQVFGWGLYFTNLKDIAKYYMSAGLDDEQAIKLDGKPLSDYNVEQEIKEQLIGIINQIFGEDKLTPTIPLIKDYLMLEYDEENYPEFKELVELSNKTYDFIKNKKLSFSGNIYSVTLFKGKKPNQYILLDWNKKPTKKILKLVLNQLEKDNVNYSLNGNSIIFKRNNANYYMSIDLINGMTLYNGVSSIFNSNDKQASLFFLRAGINGIKYEAGSLSGMEDKNAYNYVIFDADDVTIEKKETFNKGGEVSSTNIISQIWSWFGIKF